MGFLCLVLLYAALCLYSDFFFHSSVKLNQVIEDCYCFFKLFLGGFHS